MKFTTDQSIILASGSPRRKELFELLGVPFEIVTSNVSEEGLSSDMEFVEYAQSLAITKAMSVAERYPDAVVIGADTIVGLGKRIFLKPQNDAEAKVFLKELSGKTHSVVTGVAISVKGRTYTFADETKVTFMELDDALIDAYVASGDPFDKAGAYGIQSGGALFVEEIKGDYYSVMGLPIAALTRHLRMLGVITLEGGAQEDDD